MKKGRIFKAVYKDYSICITDLYYGDAIKVKYNLELDSLGEQVIKYFECIGLNIDTVCYGTDGMYIIINDFRRIF